MAENELSTDKKIPPRKPEVPDEKGILENETNCNGLNYGLYFTHLQDKYNHINQPQIPAKIAVQVLD